MATRRQAGYLHIPEGRRDYRPVTIGQRVPQRFTFRDDRQGRMMKVPE